MLSSAFAEGQPRREGLEKKQFTRVVGSGANQRIGFFYALNPDCTASGNVNVRVTKQPEHGGAVEITTATNFPLPQTFRSRVPHDASTGWWSVNHND
jgi:hypothetical protein